MPLVVGFATLLSHDGDFLNHLARRTSVALLRPTEYWERLAIPSGTKPDKVPRPENPLADKTWWRW